MVRARYAWLIVCLCSGLLLNQAVFAAPEETLAPEDIPGVTRIDAETLISLVDSLPDLLVLDSRVRANRRYGYIEGSLSLPDVDTTCASLAERAPETSRPLVFYCNGVQCARSAHAARIALGCGYSQVYWFRGGFLEWQSKGYPFLKE